jgi:transcription elongation factor Elf1
MKDKVVTLDDRRPHTSQYVTCMACAHDWIAVAPSVAKGPFECSKCGKMKGERVQYSDPEWFKRYMAGPDHTKRMLVLVNAKQIMPET